MIYPEQNLFIADLGWLIAIPHPFPPLLSGEGLQVK